MLNVLTTRKKNCNYAWGQMLTYCGYHFAVYSNIESLCYTPNNNIMLYVNYSSIQKIATVMIH